MTRRGLTDALINMGLDVDKITGLPVRALAPLQAQVAPQAGMRVVSAFKLIKDVEGVFAGEEFEGLDDAQRLFLGALAQYGTKRAACVASGVNPLTVTRWLRERAFMQLHTETMGLVGDALEEEAIRQAMTGSERLMAVLLKAFKPDKYAERRVSKSEARVDIEVRSWADLARAVVAVEESVVIDAEEVIADGGQEHEEGTGVGGEGGGGD